MIVVVLRIDRDIEQGELRLARNLQSGAACADVDITEPSEFVGLMQIIGPHPVRHAGHEPQPCGRLLGAGDPPFAAGHLGVGGGKRPPQAVERFRIPASVSSEQTVQCVGLATAEGVLVFETHRLGRLLRIAFQGEQMGLAPRRVQTKTATFFASPGSSLFSLLKLFDSRLKSSASAPSGAPRSLPITVLMIRISGKPDRSGGADVALNLYRQVAEECQSPPGS